MSVYFYVETFYYIKIPKLLSFHIVIEDCVWDGNAKDALKTSNKEGLNNQFMEREIRDRNN